MVSADSDEITVIDICDGQIRIWEERLDALHARALAHLERCKLIPSSVLDAIDKTERQLAALESVRLRASTNDEGSDDGNSD